MLCSDSVSTGPIVSGILGAQESSYGLWWRGNFLHPSVEANAWDSQPRWHQNILWTLLGIAGGRRDQQQGTRVPWYHRVPDKGAPASPQVLTWSWLEMYIQAHPSLLSQTLRVARVCSHLPPGCSMAATWRSHSRLPRAPGNCPRLRVIVTPSDPHSSSSPRKVHADPMCSQGAGQACLDAVRPLSGPSMRSPPHSLAQLMGLPSWQAVRRKPAPHSITTQGWRHPCGLNCSQGLGFHCVSCTLCGQT